MKVHLIACKNSVVILTAKSLVAKRFSSATELPFPNFLPESKQFYELEAQNRRYFYLLDTKGQLFLEDSKHRNYATCMKDKKFLDFFYKHLKPNNTELYKEKPFISPCGKELNFLTVDDPISPLVFSDLMATVEDGHFLTVGGSNLKQIFNPSEVRLCTTTGRMYHTITDHKYLASKLGLLHPLVADKLSRSLVISPNEYRLQWNNREYLIPQVDVRKA